MTSPPAIGDALESFDGRLAVVTGGGSGMGRELVVQLAADGCSVATCDLNEETVAETAALAHAGRPNGSRVTAHTCDIASEAEVNRFRDELAAQHQTDHIDLLFNNAGIGGGGSFVAGERESWERVVSVCWGGVYNCSRAFLPLLIASKAGWIINTSSVNGFWATHARGNPNTAYSTAKFAVKGFSEALIEDLRVNAPHVRVALVMPGVIRTDFAANSKRVLGDSSEADPSRGWRVSLANWGVPVERLSDEELQRMGELFRELFTTTAAEAATAILEGLRAGRWRILVGEGAHRTDRAVRADPEAAYAPDGLTLFDTDLLVATLSLGALFDSQAAADLTAEYEFRVGADTIICHVDEGRLRLTRGTASSPTATIETDPETFHALITRAVDLDTATRRGALKLSGDRRRVEQLMAAVARVSF